MLLLAHLGPIGLLPAVRKRGLLVPGHFLLLSPHLRDHLTLLQLLLLPFRFQVGDVEQAKSSRERRRGRGKRRRKLRS